MKHYTFLIYSFCIFFIACQSESHYDENLTGQMPNSAETEWLFSTEENIPDENYFNKDIRKPDLLMVDSMIVYTTKNQKLVVLNTKGKLLWHTPTHPEMILAVLADSSSIYYAYTPNPDTIALVALELKTGTKKWIQYFDNTLIPDDTSREFSHGYFYKTDTANILSFIQGRLFLCLTEKTNRFKQVAPYTFLINKRSGKILDKGRIRFQNSRTIPTGNTYLKKTNMLIDVKKKKAFLFGRIGNQQLYIHKKDTAFIFMNAPVVNDKWFVHEDNSIVVGSNLKGKKQWKYTIKGSIEPWGRIIIKDSLVILPIDFTCMGNPCYCWLSILDVRTGKPIIDNKIIGYSHPRSVNLINGKYYIALDPEPASIEAKTNNYILEIEIPSGKYLRIFRTNRVYSVKKFLIKNNKLIILNSNGEIVSMKLLGN